MKIVMVSGWKGSGKDMVAEYLVEQGFRRVAFADPLKDMVAREYNIPRSWCDDRRYKESALLQYPVAPRDAFCRMVAENMIREFRDTHNVAPHGFCYQENEFYGLVRDGDRVIKVRVYWTPRALCILKGSSNRSVISSYWIALAAENMKKDPNGLYVISDARYKSEVEQVIGIVGKSSVTTLRLNRFDITDSIDPSERDLDDYNFDVVIENRGTKLECLRAVDRALGLERKRSLDLHQETPFDLP
jgi:hypothetical protein